MSGQKIDFEEIKFEELPAQQLPPGGDQAGLRADPLAPIPIAPEKPGQQAQAVANNIVGGLAALGRGDYLDAAISAGQAYSETLPSRVNLAFGQGVANQLGFLPWLQSKAEMALQGKFPWETDAVTQESLGKFRQSDEELKSVWHGLPYAAGNILGSLPLAGLGAAGTFTKGAGIVGRAAEAAKPAAALGAAAGLGTSLSEGEGWLQNIKDTLSGGALGAGLSAAIAGPGVSIANKAANGIGKLAQRGAEAADLPALEKYFGAGALGVERGTFKKITTGQVNDLNRDEFYKAIDEAYQAGVIKPGETKTETAARFLKWLDKRGKSVGETADKIGSRLDEAGVRSIVKPGEFIDELSQKISPENLRMKLADEARGYSSIFRENRDKLASDWSRELGEEITQKSKELGIPGQEKMVNRLQSELASNVTRAAKDVARLPKSTKPFKSSYIEELVQQLADESVELDRLRSQLPGSARVSFDDILDLKRSMSRKMEELKAMGIRAPSGSQEGAKEFYGMLASKLSNAAEGVGMGRRWEAVNDAYSRIANFKEAALNAQAAEIGNMPGGMRSLLAAAPGASVAGLPGAVFSAGMSAMAKDKGASTIGYLARKYKGDVPGFGSAVSGKINQFMAPKIGKLETMSRLVSPITDYLGIREPSEEERIQQVDLETAKKDFTSGGSQP